MAKTALSIISLDCCCLDWNSFIHPYNKNLPGAHYSPGTALGAKDTADSQTYQNP